MVEGVSRKELAVVSNNTNAFAALGNVQNKKMGSSSTAAEKAALRQSSDPQLFWAPVPLNAKSWADVDDEDDDDYYATTTTPFQQSEREEHDYEQDPEPEAEPEPQPQPGNTVAKKPVEVVAPKESGRQLSKKELKKKELEELDAMLAEFGLKTEGQCSSLEKKIENSNGDVDKKDNLAAGESKSAKKKKKKKDRSIKGDKEQQEKSEGNEVDNGGDEAVSSQKAEEVLVMDMKEKLKKVASARKKKEKKDMDAAVKLAAREAAARNARLGAGKKKEKNHYNELAW